MIDLIVVYEDDWFDMSYCLIKSAFDNKTLNVDKVREYEIEDLENTINDIKGIKIKNGTETVMFMFNSGMLCSPRQHKENSDIILKRILDFYSKNGEEIYEWERITKGLRNEY